MCSNEDADGPGRRSARVEPGKITVRNDERPETLPKSWARHGSAGCSSSTAPRPRAKLSAAHKARNVIHETLRKALRQARELDHPARRCDTKHLVASCVDASADVVLTCA
jgi:hypothetical protein